MTASPSETQGTEEAVEETAVPDPAAELARSAADAVGGTVATAVATAKVRVPADRWVEAITSARDQLGLIFFSFLSAIDWSNEVAVGDPLDEEVEERFEVICTLSDVGAGRRVTFSTDLPKDDPRLDSLVGVFPGADWHEREAFEMFGIDFAGHPNLVHLYLPEQFLGHPLRKSFPLLSREVKPWPGKVDVEGMPSEEEEQEPATGEEDEGGETEGEASTVNPEA